MANSRGVVAADDDDVKKTIAIFAYKQRLLTMGMKTKDLVVVREGSHLMLSVVMVVRHLPMPIIQARVQGRGLEEDVVLVVLEDWVGGHQLEEHVSLSWPVVQGRSGV